jgi:hypothetical protein
MASPAFEFVAGEIERLTSLATLEARGTLRLALKRAGLDASSVGADQLHVVLERLMPDEIRSRGVAAPEEICRSVAAALRAAHPPDGPEPESPERIFRRLAGER